MIHGCGSATKGRSDPMAHKFVIEQNKAGEYAVWYGLFVRECGSGAAAGAS